jgi:hypothetical protein
MKIITKMEQKMFCPKCGIELEQEKTRVVTKRKKHVRFTREELETIKNWSGDVTDLATQLDRSYSSVWLKHRKFHLTL